MPTDATQPTDATPEEAAFAAPPALADYGTPPAAPDRSAPPRPEVDIHVPNDATGETDATDNPADAKTADTFPSTGPSGSEPPSKLEIAGMVAAVIVVLALVLSGALSPDRSNESFGNKRTIAGQDEQYVEPDPMTVSEVDVAALATTWSTDGLPLTGFQVGTEQDLTGFQGTLDDHYHRWTPTTSSAELPPAVHVYTRTPKRSPVNKPLEDTQIVLVTVGISEGLNATFSPRALDPMVLEDPAGFAAVVKLAVRGISPGDQVIIDVDKYGDEVSVNLEATDKPNKAAAAEAKFRPEQDRLLNQIASSAKPNEALVEKLIKSAIATHEAKGIGPTDLYVVHAYGSNLEPTAPNGTPLPEWLFGEHGKYLISHDPGRESDFSIPIWFDLGRG